MIEYHNEGGGLVPASLPVNPALVYLGTLAPSGRRTQRQALDTIARLMTRGRSDAGSYPWERLRYEHAALIRTRLNEQYAPATVNKMLAALRGVLRQAWRLGLMDASDYQAAADVRGVTGSRLPAGRELAPGEIAALMGACEVDPTPAGTRDAALIALMYATGLRRQEVTRLRAEQYEGETGRLTVVGKRSKERAVYLTGGAARALEDWLQLRGPDAGPLFVPISKSGKLRAAGLTPQAVYNALVKRAEAAGVEHFSPHDLRRTFVSDLLDAGADIATVAKMAGHASVQTTARYDRRPEQAKRKAAGLLHVPYRGKRVAP